MYDSAGNELGRTSGEVMTWAVEGDAAYYLDFSGQVMRWRPQGAAAATLFGTLEESGIWGTARLHNDRRWALHPGPSPGVSCGA
jgi:hypothetical protein